MSRADDLIDANVRVLHASARLIARLDDALYRRVIGPQVRHCLDFYGCLLAGLASGRIDYAARAREATLEVNRAVASERSAAVGAALRALDRGPWSRTLLVRSEAEPTVDDELAWSPSSLRRELEFLLSHTVHHQALLASLLRAGGIEPGADFGVAPSTLRHRRALALAS